MFVPHIDMHTLGIFEGPAYSNQKFLAFDKFCFLTFNLLTATPKSCYTQAPIEIYYPWKF